jgi:ribosomal protein S18 acetylase RimI-like enzyme
MEVVRSLGYRTSLSLLQRAGSAVVDHGDHVVVSTAENPGFWWGNFLLLRHRPSVDQVPAWVARFEAELPWADHRAFGLDDSHAPSEAFSAFADLGYLVERNAVLTATGSVPRTSHRAADATYRPLEGDSDWAQHLELSLIVYPGSEDAPASSFAHERAKARRRVVEAGGGVWVGAFVEGQLVSQLGVIRAGRGLGRYQDVETHPGFRRRGLAGTLVGLAGNLALASPAITTLVMVADPDDEAIRLYRSLGFTESEHQLEGFLPPP